MGIAARDASACARLWRRMSSADMLYAFGYISAVSRQVGIAANGDMALALAIISTAFALGVMIALWCGLLQRLLQVADELIIHPHGTIIYVDGPIIHADGRDPPRGGRGPRGDPSAHHGARTHHRPQVRVLSYSLCDLSSSTLCLYILLLLLFI